MSYDLEGAVTVARVIADFDWSWKSPDLTRLAAVLRWHTMEKRRATVTFDTRFDIPNPRAIASMGSMPFSSADVLQLDITIGTYDATNNVNLVRKRVDLFVACSEQLVVEIGTPTYRVAGRFPTLGWKFPKVEMYLHANENSLCLTASNPRYQEFLSLEEGE